MPNHFLRLSAAFLLLTLGLVACARSDATNSSSSNTVAVPQASTPLPSSSSESAHAALAPTAKVDVCGLLTTAEIQSIQGEPLKETKVSGTTENGLLVSQCFFSLPTFANSVNVVLTQKGEGNGMRDPREFWKETFDRNENEKERERGSKKNREQERKADRSEEEDKEGAPPKKIAGLGDEAFWQGSRVGGALYVLKGNKYIRISIGGAGDQQARINKAKALAAFALKRL